MTWRELFPFAIRSRAGTDALIDSATEAVMASGNAALQSHAASHVADAYLLCRALDVHGVEVPVKVAQRIKELATW